jgi:hypothetical protein
MMDADAARTWELDSASGVVSVGPAVQVPAETERIQFTWFVWSGSLGCVYTGGMLKDRKWDAEKER